MSFYNQLKSTQACGTFQNSDYPGGGLQANAIFDRNVTVSQNLTVTGTTSLGTLLPIPSVAVNNTATLPASTSNEVFIVSTGTTTYIVTLPAPVTGYTLWFLNKNTSAVTVAAPTNNTLVYENPIGTFNTGTNVSMTSNATLGLFSDGTLWYVFYNSGLVSQLSSGIATLQYWTYNRGANAVEDSINMIVDGTLTVNTGPLNLTSGTASFPIRALNLTGVAPSISTITTTGSMSGNFANGGIANFTSSTPITWTIANQSSANGCVFTVINTSSATHTLSFPSTGLVLLQANGTYASSTTVSLAPNMRMVILQVSTSSWLLLNQAYYYDQLYQYLSGLTSTAAQLGSAETFTALQTFSGGLTVSAGAITVPSASIANAALATGKLSDANTWSALNTYSNGLTISSGNLNLTSGTASFPVRALNLTGVAPSISTITTTSSMSGNFANGGIANFTSSTPITWTIANQSAGNGSVFIVVNTSSATHTLSFPSTGLVLLQANGTYASSTTVSLAPNMRMVILQVSTSSWLLLNQAYYYDQLYQYLSGLTSTAAQLGSAETFTALQTFSGGLTVSAGAITVPSASIANAALATGKLTDNNTFSGNNTFNGTSTFGANLLANSQTITPTQLGYVSGATSNLQTQITNLANSISGTISYGWVFYDGTNYTLSFGVNVTGVTNASNVVTVETTFSGNNAVAGIANAQQQGILVQGVWSQRTPTVKWAFTLLNSTTATAQNSSFAFLIIAY